jgi:RNA polymerase sigma-70 factor, ECF subfamily
VEEGLLAIYDEALPSVFGYLLSRSGDRTIAEDLTSETFFSALRAAQADPTLAISIEWLIGIARHKMVDHWRRQERVARRQQELVDGYDHSEDPWDAHLDALLVRDVLRQLGPHHQAALSLRYLDGLPVAEVAEFLGRSRTATETLLMRAKAAFRSRYEAGEGVEHA